jgi:putative Ig domain-containing protein
MTAWSTTRHFLIAFAITMLCAGCFGSESSEDVAAAPPPAGAPPPAVNHPPIISGTPPASLSVGQALDFRPTASDPDGDALTFSIQNRPQWAAFNSSNGRLSGTPGAADVGQFTGVAITVSDGRASANLGAFTIGVNQIALGSVTMSWTPPTTNADGSTITDLAGYRIYYGQNSGSLSETVVINNAGTVRYVIDNLSPATWHFSMTSYDTSGVESMRSPVVSRTLT